MRMMHKVFAVSALALALSACTENETQADIDLENEDVSQAYALGASIGIYVEENLRMQEEAGIQLDKDIIIAGFTESVRGEGQMTRETAEEIVIEFQEKIIRQIQQANEEAAGEGIAYLEENSQRDEVQVTNSGLQYEVIREGDGEQPQATDVVQVHYEGRLVNGHVFDSSYERGEPATFPLNQVIAGWTEGLQLMREGAHYQFVIPAGLAYGDRDVGGQIPPNSTLIFEVELLEIIREDSE